jgi:hypothetical protein
MYVASSHKIVQGAETCIKGNILEGASNAQGGYFVRRCLDKVVIFVEDAA